MFMDATSFTQELCGASWVHSIAWKDRMFLGSSGSISTTACTSSTRIFSPRSKEALREAVNACLELSANGDCSKGAHGPIATWDVSRVTDMSSLFRDATSFRGDISKWDVSRVTDMSYMFNDASSFNGDISNWDVSTVSDMDYMFIGATSFDRQLCGISWVRSTARKDSMFLGSSGSISPTVCTDTTLSDTFVDVKRVIKAIH